MAVEAENARPFSIALPWPSMAAAGLWPSSVAPAWPPDADTARPVSKVLPQLTLHVGCQSRDAKKRKAARKRSKREANAKQIRAVGGATLDEDMIEALFMNNSMPAAPPRDTGRKPAAPAFRQEERVLDPKKAQNIAILLRALNVTREEVSDALLDDAKSEKQNTTATSSKDKGLKVVCGLSSELGNVKKAASMDFDVLHGYVSKLETGLEKIKSVLQLERQCTQGQRFFIAMQGFLKEADKEIEIVRGEEKRALGRVKDITDYFHGDAAKEEAHPLRIFMVVRDFLSMLDHVCREVGRMQQDRTVVGSARSFRVSTTAPLPVLSLYGQRRQNNSDDDDDSMSS
ncbi:hypothetical protein TRIUR3_01461 [Triticum urartu]|uniref:Uncharacterized protein n=1 Tax=Triticum urartu TaxID=4572 RepID=M7ZAC4_TRIUA|nr:hypothetical protein TRIUR3_01461 [Triticum urartu]